MRMRRPTAGIMRLNSAITKWLVIMASIRETSGIVQIVIGGLLYYFIH